MVEMFKVRELTTEEKDFLRKTPKILKEKIRWEFNRAGTVRIGVAEIWPENKEKLPNVQISMSLITKVIIPTQELIYYYKIKSPVQIIRMYHRGHIHYDAINGLIEGDHKHYFESDRTKRTYPVDDIGMGVIQAIKDFFIEENIGPESAITPFTIDTKLSQWEGNL